MKLKFNKYILIPILIITGLIVISFYNFKMCYCFFSFFLMAHKMLKERKKAMKKRMLITMFVNYHIIKMKII